MTYEAAFADVISAVTGASTQAPELAGEPGSLPSHLPVEDIAAATAAAALVTTAEWQQVVTGRRPEVALHRDHVAAAFRSEVHVRLDGAHPGGGFAPLSRFWPVADGAVRTHANYAWHRAALLRTLGIADAAGDVETVGAALAPMSAADVEARVTAAGGLAVAVDSAAAWRPRSPLVLRTTLGDAQPRAAQRPLRVLDLTRVIAGPVGTRWLAALGADVLRLDPPALPELWLHVVDGLVGKRSALLDAGTPDGLATLHRLLDQADVVVHGYRPGALERYGLDPGSLADRHPGIVSVSLSAWGGDEQRRGFDSIVQAACGIALIESPGDGRPGALPCQLLDHGTGYLIAAAALDGLVRQRTTGATQVRELSLAATASWAMGLPRTEPAAPTELDVLPWLTTLGRLTAVTPPGSLDGRQLSWPSGLPEYGADAPVWT